MSAGARVVLGFSSVGKSTYIRHLMTSSESFRAACPVYEFMFRSGERQGLCPGDLFHMDMSALSGTCGTDPACHPLTACCLRCGIVEGVDMLVAAESVIRTRIAGRQHNGIGFLRDDSKAPYPREAKNAVLDFCPLHLRYAAWICYLGREGIPVRYLHSDNLDFRPVATAEEALAIIAGRQLSAA